MMKVAECGSSRNTTKSWKSHSSKSQVGLTYQFCKEAQILMQCIHLHCWASQMYHPNLDRGMALWSPQSGRHDRESWRQTPTRFTFYFSLLQKPEISKSKDNDNIYTEDITEQTLKSFIFASRICQTQRQYWICRSFLMSRSIAMVCTLQRFPKRGNSSQFIALLTGLRPSILPSCLILAQFTAQGGLTQQIRFELERDICRSGTKLTDTSLIIHPQRYPGKVSGSVTVTKSSRELSGIHWKTLEDIVCPHHTIVSHGVSHVVSHGAWHGFGIPQGVWCGWNCWTHSLTHWQ